MSAAHRSPDRRSRPWWKKKRFLVLGLILLLLMALGSFVLWLTATGAGARWSFERLGGALPGTLEVGSLEGPLRGPLLLRDVRWEREDGPTVTLEEARLEWRLPSLLRRQVDVHSLRARGIDVRLAPSTGEEPGLPDVNLRFNVVVREVRIEDLVIRSAAEGAEPVRIESMALDTATVGDRVEITAFDLRSSELDLDLGGSFIPRGDYPVDLEIDWAFRREGWPELRGRGSLDRTLAELEVDQGIDVPFEATARGTLLDPLYDLRFRDLRVRFEGFRPRTFFPEAPVLVAAGDVTLDGLPSSLDSRGTVRADTEEWGPLRAEYELSLPGDELRFESLVLERPDASTRVRAAGSLGLGDPLRFDAELAWRDLPFPPTETEGATLVSPTGEGSIRGTLESYELAATGDLRGGSVPPGSWRLRGTGTDTELRIDRLDARVLGGALGGTAGVRWQPELSWRVDLVGEDIDPLALVEGLPEDLAEAGRWELRATGDAEEMRFRRLEGAVLRGRVEATGTFGWADHPTWNADLEATGVDPGILWEPVRGDVDLAATTSGSAPPAGVEATVAVRELDGTVGGAPVSGAGSLALAGSRYRADEVALRWGEATLEADGALGGEEGLAFTVRDLSLDRVLDAATGTLARAEGRLLGSPEAPRIRTTLQADRVAWSDLSAASLAGSLDVGTTSDAPLEADLTARRPVWGAWSADLLRLRAEGERAEHRLELVLEADATRLASSVRGAVTETGWAGRVTALSLRDPRFGKWSLVEPAPLEISAGAVELGRFCWTSDGAVSCAEGRWSDDGLVTADLDLTELPLELVEPLLPADLRVRGTVDGEATVRTLEDGLVVGSLRLQPAPGAVLYSAGREETVRLTFSEGLLAAEAGTEGIDARLDLTVADGDPVRARLSLPPYRLGTEFANLALDGSLEARTDRLAIVSAFVPDLSETAGRLAVDLDLGGTPVSPEVRGTARLTGGSARVPAFGLHLTEIEVTLRDEGDGPLTLDGRLRSGPGSLAVSGRVPLGLDTEQPLVLELDGERVLVSDTEEARVLASPDLDIRHDGELVRATGEIRIPEAGLEIERRPPGAISVTEDVVYVNEVPEATADPGLDVEARIRLILGDDVDFEGFGIEATLEGSLLLRDTPDRPTMATGEIRTVRGTYEAYGQELTIERGRLVFAGPITEPRVSLRAYREARDGTVAGIEASGPLRSPEVSLWSEEPMSESEQLSYVVLGRPLRRATGAEEEALLDRAATSLGLAAGGFLAERLGEKLGLERFEIDTDRGAAEAELVLGTYLSPRVYIGYGIGLFDAVSTFEIRYLVSDRWTLEARTGRETSGDVLYVIERGDPKPDDSEPGDRPPAELETPDSPADLEPVPVPTEDEHGEDEDEEPDRSG